MNSYFATDQRALGFSMRVERAGVDDVRQKLLELKQKTAQKPLLNRPSALEEHDKKLKEQHDQKEALKRKFKEDADAKKRQKIFEDEQDQTSDVETEQIDPEFAAMMGFGGFGSSKKK
jgi:U4/U6.U5 tri-snRNP component SNU23